MWLLVMPSADIEWYGSGIPSTGNRLLQVAIIQRFSGDIPVYPTPTSERLVIDPADSRSMALLAIDAVTSLLGFAEAAAGVWSGDVPEMIEPSDSDPAVDGLTY